jgi:hypothetical protein
MWRMARSWSSSSCSQDGATWLQEPSSSPQHRTSPQALFEGLLLMVYTLDLKLFTSKGDVISRKARESLVSDIPAGDRKIINLFLQCMSLVGFDSR